MYSLRSSEMSGGLFQEMVHDLHRQIPVLLGQKILCPLRWIPAGTPWGRRTNPVRYPTESPSRYSRSAGPGRTPGPRPSSPSRLAATFREAREKSSVMRYPTRPATSCM